jgi:RHS repeat-associated protein
MQTEKNLWLRVLSMILTLALLISCIPNQVYAMAGEALADLWEGEKDTVVLQPNINPGFKLGPAHIVTEDESRRGESYKEYIMNNGLRLATVYPSAIHYEDNGQWKDIDNTLVAAVSGGKAVYQNAAGAWNVCFPRTLSGNDMVGVTKDGYTVQFGMAGEMRSAGGIAVASIGTIGQGEVADALAVNSAQTATAQIQQLDLTAARAAAEHPETVLDKLNSRLFYANVYPNTNVVYDLQGNRLKESIVLQRYDADLWGYRYTLDTGDLVPVLREDQQIDLCHPETNEVVLTMPAPYMLDNNGETSYDVEVSLTRNGSKYLLSYYLPRAWLAEADRVWPVILDPVTEFPGNYSNVDDITVCQNYNEDMGRGVIQCGYSSSAGAMRFYMKFIQMPTMKSADVIVNASIRLHKPYASGTTSNVSIHKVTEEWSQSDISWVTQPDFDTDIEDYVVCKPAGHYTWNITDIVRDWYEAENYGMVFKAQDSVEKGTTDNWKQFYSSDYNLSTNDIPVLTIYYQNYNGMESYWNYTSVSAGRAGTGYVQNYSGNLIWVHSDMGFDGNRMPVSISHVYSANDAGSNRFGLGNGWRTNYNQTITAKTATDGTPYYLWEDGDGTVHEFFEYCDSVYKDIDNLGLLLTELTSGYVITDKYDNASYFDTYGRLTSQVNNQQTTSRILISYEATNSLQIKEIYDGVDRKYSFSYIDGLLNRIDFYGTGTSSHYHVQYTYTNNNLTSITYRDRKSSLFTYSSKNILLSASDIDGYKITFGYNTMADNESSRVVSVLESDDGNEGTNTTFEYSYRRTQLEDHNGNTQTMFFNEWGNTISIQDSEGKAVFYQYDTDVNENGVKNRLLTTSKEQNTTINLIANSSFEESNDWTAGSSSTECVRNAVAHYVGDRSLKSMCNSNTGGIGAQKGVYTIAKGETYTFSAYVRAFPDSGVKLRISDDLGTVVYSELLNGGNKWTRLEVTYTNTSSAARKITLSLYHTNNGSAYIDCVQLEKNRIASRYNMLDDGDFSQGFGDTTPWVSYTEGMEEPTANNDGSVLNLDATRVMIEGDVDGRQFASQTVQVAGKANDRYVFSGWTTGNALPDDKDSRFYGLRLFFNNKDGSSTMFRVAANPNLSNEGMWQYLAGQAIADKDYTSITIIAEYSYNANTVFFDGLQLYKEEFGESYTYDEDTGNVTEVRDVLGQVTRYVYNSSNDPILTYLPNGIEIVCEYSYHNTTSEKKWYYDENGIRKNINSNTYVYNAVGNLTEHEFYADGVINTTEYGYAAAGNFLSYVEDNLGNRTTYGYNAETSVLEWIQYPNDTVNTRTHYTYDNMYRLDTTYSLTSEDAYFEVSYYFGSSNAPSDNLTFISTETATYEFEYGSFSLRTKVTVGNRTLATYSYTNDKNKYLETLAYGNGDKVKYTYDELGRVVKETYYENGSTNVYATVTYQYDNTGALASVYDSKTGKTVKYYYDTIGRVSGLYETGGTAHSLRYTYDDLGRPTAIVDTYGSTTYSTEYTYDGQGHIFLVDNGDASEVYLYDSHDRFHEAYTFHGDSNTHLIHKTIGYEAPDDRSTSNRVSMWNYATTGEFGRNYNYLYDGNGNIVRVKQDGDKYTYYHYDTANQLIREDNQVAGKTWVWTYDDGGNIKSRKEYAYTTVPTENLGSPSKTYTYGYGISDWRDLLTSFDGENLYWDEIGNLLRDGEYDYTWIKGRQLAKMEGVQNWYFTYDANGMRTKRSGTGGVYTYVYNGSQLAHMTYGSNTLHFTYDANGGPLSVNYNGTTYYYVLNLQGDVVAILNSYGFPVVEYTYDAWGKLLTTTGSMAGTLGLHNPLRYRGYVYDEETKLYYLQSRYYNPEIGRFISADAYVSTGQGILGNNMFAYCGNNPVNRIDPTGEKFVDWLQDTWNGVCDFFFGAYEFVTNSDASTTQDNLKNYGVSFYNGTLVLSAALPFDESAFSFGIIVMDDYYKTASSSTFSRTLNHEYGHTRHFRQVGLHTYAATVVVPSLIGAGLSYISPWVKTNYRSLPWERVAEHLGDVNGTYLPGSNTAGSIFWIYTLIYSFVSPF